MWVFPAVSQSRGHRAGPGVPNFNSEIGFGEVVAEFYG